MHPNPQVDITPSQGNFPQNLAITNDGKVNGSDLALVLAYWGSDDALTDINSDGIVNAEDITFILGSWSI